MYVGRLVVYVCGMGASNQMDNFDAVSLLES